MEEMGSGSECQWTGKKKYEVDTNLHSERLNNDFTIANYDETLQSEQARRVS